MQYDTCAFFHDCLLFALLPVYKLTGLQHKVCLTPSVALLQPLVDLRLAESNALSLLVKGNEVSTRPSIDSLFCRMAWKIITKSFEVKPLIFLLIIRGNGEPWSQWTPTFVRWLPAFLAWHQRKFSIRSSYYIYT